MKENIIKNKSTPAMRQYWDAKKEYPDAIMLFRMGDFYETFDTDAEITSDILDIALTKRANGGASSVPLAGFPYHSLEQHIHKLLSSGYKVAICEQVEDPKLSKGIVKRAVVEVLSPGTAIATKYLDSNENNFLGSIYIYKNEIGYSIVDNSTGEFLCGLENKNNILNIIKEYKLKEIIIPSFQKEELIQIVNSSLMVTAYDDWKSDYDHCYEKLNEQFNTKSLKGYGIDDNKLLIISAGACLFYLEDNSFKKGDHITSISRIKEKGYMRLDDFTLKNLEVFDSLNNQGSIGTLINTIDLTITSMGSRLLKSHLRKPLTNIKTINSRLNTIDELINNQILLDDIVILLKQVYDLERIIARISNDKANPLDVINLSKTLSVLNQINKKITVKQKNLKQIVNKQNNMKKLVGLIDKTIIIDPPINFNKGYFINKGINKELDQYRMISEDANKWLVDYQDQERKKTKISSLKISYNKVFGYYIDVTKVHLDKVPDYYIRKQTLTNSERYFTDELKEYEEKILYSNDKSIEIEKEIFNDLKSNIVKQFKKIQYNAKILASVDVFISHSLVAINYNYSKPKFNSKNNLEVIKGRHPVVERLLPLNEDFISNDLILLNNKKHLAIITGPNMSGKSTFLRQTGLIVLLAQIGSFVPAEKCTLGIVDQLFTRVGASDNLAGGESTFLVEMNESANILNNATNKSLIILDEIGRGTSTFDGLSLAWAITEYLHNNKAIKAKALFATHYHELIELAENLSGAFNLNVEVVEKNDKIVFLRKIKDGGASKSYGIQVAEMAGLPNKVISRAKNLLIDFMNKKINKKSDVNQLNLFDKDSRLVKIIKKIDIDSLSPLDALNVLNDLQDEIK